MLRGCIRYLLDSFYQSSVWYSLAVDIASTPVAEYYSVPEKSSLVISTESDESMNSTITINTTFSEWTSLIFNTSLGHRIIISFKHLCFKDHSEVVEIGDGSDMGNDTRLARFSRKTLPSDVTSVSNAAWIRIHFPDRDRLLRVRMIITSINVTEEVLTLGRQLFLSSHGFPDSYPNNAYNIWFLQAPKTSVIGIHFFQFDSESGADVLYIWEYVESFAVSSLRWKHLSGYYGEIETIWYNSSLTVIFTSNGDSPASGFLIGYTAEERVSTARTTIESDSDATNLTTHSSSNQGVSISSIEPHTRFSDEFDINRISQTTSACATSSAESATSSKVGLATRILSAAFTVTTCILLLIFIRWAYLKRQSYLRDMNQRAGNHKITYHPERENEQPTYMPMFEGQSPANEFSISLKSNPEDTVSDPVRVYDEGVYLFPLAEEKELVKMAQKSSTASVNLATCTILERSSRRPDDPDDPEHHIYEAPEEMKTKA